jgi:hypothetical protein
VFDELVYAVWGGFAAAFLLGVGAGWVIWG